MKASKILILDDDETFRKMLRGALGIVFRVDEAGDASEFRTKFQPFRFDLLLLDMRLHVGREGLEVLRWVCEVDPLQPVIMLSEFGNADAAIEAVSTGAMMFLHKQEFTATQLIRMAEAAIEQGKLRREAQAMRDLAWRGEPDYLIGSSRGMLEARERLQSMARSPRATSMIFGEMGTGRSLVSRLLHRGGSRGSGPYVELDAKRLVRHRRFALADLRQADAWKEACLGTLVLDHFEAPVDPLMRELTELGKLPESNTRPEHEPRVVVIADAVAGGGGKKSPMGALRGDDESAMHIPPLRQRREDIAILAHRFIHEQRERHGVSVATLSSDAIERLEEHDWPGNVRELRNAIEFAALQAGANDEGSIECRHLPGKLRSSRSTAGETSSWDYRYQISRAEVELVHQAIIRRGITVKTRMADELGYSDRFTLLRRMRRALSEYPSIAKEFPAVADLFLKTGKAGESQN